MKRHIQYLGHLISPEGIQPLPKKLESIRNMSVPKKPKEIKQFLGLAGYYCKFVTRFSDSRPSPSWPIKMSYLNGQRNVKLSLKCWKSHSASSPYWSIQIQRDPMYFSWMQVSIDGKVFWLNHTLTTVMYWLSPMLSKLMSWMCPAQTKLMEHLRQSSIQSPM